MRTLRLSLLLALAAGAAATGAQESSSLEQLQRYRPDCEQSDGGCAAANDDAEPTTTSSDNGTLDIAHKAAIRHREMESRALRELLLQRACSNRTAYCQQSGAPDCAAQLAQMCTAVAQQAAACLQRAVAYCTTFPQNPNCLRERQLSCPSAKRQPMEVLLAKYPKLSAQQIDHIRLVGRQMDEKLGSSWVGDLFRWLGFSS